MKLIISAALAVSFAVPAWAFCAPESQIRTTLQEKYGETVQIQGVGNNHLLQVYANTETGTWTIVVTSPDKRACVSASGQNYQAVSDVLGPNL